MHANRPRQRLFGSGIRSLPAEAVQVHAARVHRTTPLASSRRRCFLPRDAGPISPFGVESVPTARCPGTLSLDPPNVDRMPGSSARPHLREAESGAKSARNWRRGPPESGGRRRKTWRLNAVGSGGDVNGFMCNLPSLSRNYKTSRATGSLRMTCASRKESASAIGATQSHLNSPIMVMPLSMKRQRHDHERMEDVDGVAVGPHGRGHPALVVEPLAEPHAEGDHDADAQELLPHRVEQRLPGEAAEEGFDPAVLQSRRPRPRSPDTTRSAPPRPTPTASPGRPACPRTSPAGRPAVPPRNRRYIAGTARAGSGTAPAR